MFTTSRHIPLTCAALLQLCSLHDTHCSIQQNNHRNFGIHFFFPNFRRRISCMSAKMDSERSIYGAIAGTFVRPQTASASTATVLLLFAFVAVASLQIATWTPFPRWTSVTGNRPPEVLESAAAPEDPRSCGGFFEGGAARRKAVKSIREFGGVGDGKTSETEAFRRAVRHLRRFGESGGSQLNVPRGQWLTGSFNLTSNFTLFLEDGAVLLGSQDPEEWPIIEPLPSYGRGRERLGGRHISLIHGDGITNVVITGQNGTIDGQGKMWWELWWNRTLNHTRGHLLEIMNSQNILISNLTFRNSPFWTIHPVYCSNVVIKNMTILAPLNAPNTDGIDPDSSTNVCIEDCYIESGDDLVAVKSGWDQYGINMARPSSNIIVRKVSGTTPTCSGVGIGSEMSGGISNVIIEDMHIWDSAAGVRIKSDKGRGGYVTNISISNIKMERVKIPIRFSRGSNDHPDNGWDPNAVPTVKGISISNVLSINSTKAPELKGIEGASFEEICFKNFTVLGLAQSAAWHCELVSGYANAVFPIPCPEVQKGGFSLRCP